MYGARIKDSDVGPTHIRRLSGRERSVGLCPGSLCEISLRCGRSRPYHIPDALKQPISCIYPCSSFSKRHCTPLVGILRELLRVYCYVQFRSLPSNSSPSDLYSAGASILERILAKPDKTVPGDLNYLLVHSLLGEMFAMPSKTGCAIVLTLPKLGVGESTGGVRVRGASGTTVLYIYNLNVPTLQPPFTNTLSPSSLPSHPHQSGYGRQHCSLQK